MLGIEKGSLEVLPHLVTQPQPEESSTRRHISK